MTTLHRRVATAAIGLVAAAGLGVLVGDAQTGGDPAAVDLPPLVLKDPFREHRTAAQLHPRRTPVPPSANASRDPFTGSSRALANLPVVHLKNPFAESSRALINLPEVYLKDPFAPALKNPFAK